MGTIPRTARSASTLVCSDSVFAKLSVMPVDFSGTWELEHSDNFHEYLSAMGMPDHVKEKWTSGGNSLIITKEGDKDFRLTYTATGITILIQPGNEYSHDLPMKEVRGTPVWTSKNKLTTKIEGIHDAHYRSYEL